MRRRAPVLALLLAAGACARDPVDALCPNVGPGDLVITEIRGPQSSRDDVLGQWVEIYNGTSAPVALAGLALTIRKTNGSAEGHIIVRSQVSAGAGEYVVLGQFPTGAEPAYVTYGFQQDFPDNLYSAAQLVLSSCGTVIDSMVYRSLPGQGTLSFDGGRVPDAAANDDVDNNWCVDTQGDGYPGTPLMRNLTCAP